MSFSPSLSRIVLIKLALRVVVVVFVATGLGFWHAFEAFRDTRLQALERDLKLRVERENELFRLAEDNLLRLRDRYLEALAEPPEADLDADFERRFEIWPDGAIRHRAASHDTQARASAYVSRNVVPTAAVKHRLITQQDLATRYGRAWESRFVNTYIASLDGVFATFQPDVDWAAVSPPDIEKILLDLPWVRIATAELNPARGPAWTAVYLDEFARVAGATHYLFVTCTVPIDEDGRFAHYVGTDVSVDDIVARNAESAAPGGWNLIFTRAGQLVAHPQLSSEIAAHAGEFSIPEHGDDRLQAIWRAVTAHDAPLGVVRDRAQREYLGFGLLESTGWYFVTVLPEHVVTDAAWAVMRILLLLGVLSFVLEVLIFRHVLRREVARPLLGLSGTAERLAAGDWHARVPAQHSQELAKVAAAFNTMTDALAERERRIRAHAEELEARVAERTAELRAIFEASPVPMARLVNRVIVDANKASETMFGYPVEELLNRSTRMLHFDDDSYEHFGRIAYAALAEGSLRRLEVRMRRRSGETFWALVSMAYIDRSRPDLGVVLLCEDISERKAREERTAHQAMHDALTGLPNRPVMEVQIARELARAARAGGALAVLFIDLDGFKQINDRHGHDVGDLMLRHCARRLAEALRRGDVVARWGGDEFVVLLHDSEGEDAASETARRIIETLAIPLEWQGCPLSVGASIGIAFGPAHGDTAESLLRAADRAMYAAKLAGGGRWTVYSGHPEGSAG